MTGTGAQTRSCGATVSRSGSGAAATWTSWVGLTAARVLCGGAPDPFFWVPGSAGAPYCCSKKRFQALMATVVMIVFGRRYPATWYRRFSSLVTAVV